MGLVLAVPCRGVLSLSEPDLLPFRGAEGARRWRRVDLWFRIANMLLGLTPDLLMVCWWGVWT